MEPKKQKSPTNVSWQLKANICQPFLENDNIPIITYEELERKGCSIEQISQLLEEEFLVVDRELEFSVSADGLYQLGVYLKEQEQYKEALKYFAKCLAIDSNYYLAIYSSIYEDLITWKFEDIYKLIRKLYQINNPYIRQVANLYLYLLAFFSPISDGYLKEKLEQATLELKDASRPVMLNGFKEIRDAVLQGEGHNVIRKDDSDSQTSPYTEYFKNAQEAHALKQLIYFSSVLKGLTPLVQTRRYEELRDLLEKRLTTTTEDKVLSYCLKIINIILDLDKFDFKTPSTVEAPNTFDAIDQGNYYKAAICNVDFRYNEKEKKLENLLSLLLFDLLEKIGQRKKQKTYKENSEPERITIAYISSTLEKEDFEQFLSLLRRYLIQIDELDKYELISLNTMLLILNDEKDYRKIVKLLISITAGEYKLNEVDYIEQYQKYLSQGKNKQAEVVLSILELYGTGERKAEYANLKKQLSTNSTPSLSAASQKYDKLLKLYTVKNQMYHDLRCFNQGDSSIEVIEYDSRFQDDLRLKKDIWFENRDAGLDIAIVSDGNSSIALLRKVSSEEDPIPKTGKTEYFNELINQLNAYLEQEKHEECITRINELLRKESFYIYSNEVTIDIFVILIKANLGKIKTKTCLDFDYKGLKRYLIFIRAINKKESLGLDSKIEEVANLIDSSPNAVLNDLWELADNWAYTIKNSKLDLSEGIANIKRTDEIPEEDTTILMIKVAYAIRLHANRAADREQILTEVRRNKMYPNCASFIEGKISDSKKTPKNGPKSKQRVPAGQVPYTKVS